MSTKKETNTEERTTSNFPGRTLCGRQTYHIKHSSKNQFRMRRSQVYKVRTKHVYRHCRSRLRTAYILHSLLAQPSQHCKPYNSLIPRLRTSLLYSLCTRSRQYLSTSQPDSHRKILYLRRGWCHRRRWCTSSNPPTRRTPPSRGYIWTPPHPRMFQQGIFCMIQNSLH